MSSTEKVSESAPRVFRDKNYVFDNKLKVIPSGWDSPGNTSELSRFPPATFPSLKTFANLANVAYFHHSEDGKLTCPPEDELQLEGFTFLAAANNPGRLNGYYGVAYVNRERRQIVLSHRGTVLSTIGALFADLMGIVRKNFVPQVASATTFAHKVVDYAAKQGFDVFFTGHSLGAWLAQITTFSTMYLTLDEVTGHFVGKQSPLYEVRMPFTVVFDSPGAYEFLCLLKKALFPRHDESTQEINVEALPVEVFLFHPNPVNCVNHQIGRLFVLDVQKVGVDTGKYFGAATHGIGPVVQLLSDLGEEDAIKWRVIDFREGKKDFTLNSRDVRERTVPWNKSSVPAYFLSKEERKFLEGAKRDFQPDGQFEGVDGADEEMAKSLVGATKGEHLWKLSGGEESVVTADGWDRREFIPRVRHIVRCLRQRGTLWWNPTRSQLPTNYVDRRMCPTARLQVFTDLSANEQKEQNEIKKLSATEVLMKKEKLVLFVDPPGMGKSSSMTQLEMQLRSEVSLSRRVILRLNLNRVQDILESEDAENETIGGPQSAMGFIQKFVQNIPVNRLQQTFPRKPLPLYVLLDGLDEVCPLYEQIMLRLLRRLLAHTPQRLFSVHKVILTTRPHLQKLIEDAFNVQANSLLPLQFQEQVEFLEKEVGLSMDAAKECLYSIPSKARSLMENPLMLSLYARVLKSHGNKAIVNIFDLYSQFVAAKHELHVVEKEEAESAKMTTRRRVRSMLEDNLRFYFACAVHELLGSLKTKAISGQMKACDLGVGFLEQPTGTKLEELISFGLLMSAGRFKHRSFAEFFYAQLLTTEAEEYKQFREALFGRMYEYKVNENVERFVCEILLRRQAERRGTESPDNFPEFCLQEEQAALYLGKERLERLVNGWIDSQKYIRRTLAFLLRAVKEPHKGDYDVPRLTSPLENVGGELEGAEDKESALRQFYRGRLFVFLCGRSVLMRLDYSNPHIFQSIKSDTETFGLFWKWLCGLEDRSWVRAKVFGINEESVSVAEGGGLRSEGSAEVIRMFAVRTDHVSEFLSDGEISGALNSLDLVVDDGWRMEAVQLEKVRRTLEKYVDPPRLQRSLLAHLKTVGDFVLNRDLQGMNLEWSWWYAEVFSRSDVLSFVSPYASRVPSIPGISWRAVHYAWGEEFVSPCEGKTRLRIKEGDLVCLINLWEEVCRGGLKLEGNLMDAIREMIFWEISGCEILEMLERRLVRHVGTNANSCLSQEPNSATNLVEQLFEFEDAFGVYTNLFSDMDSEHISDLEANGLFKWLPFIVRYSGEPETINRILTRLSSYTKTIDKDKLVSAACSFLLAYSSEATGSSSVCKLIRSFLGGLETKPDSLLNLLLETDERELRTLIKENSPGTPPAVTHTPLGPLLIYLLHKNQSTSDESKSTPSWGLTMGSSWDAESVAFIFRALIETSPCSELPRVLRNFLSSFSPDLLKKVLTLYEHVESKRRFQCRKYTFVNTEGICRLRATIRCYFVVFGEDLQWTEKKINEVYLLTRMPVEILSVLEDKEDSTVQGFPPLQIGTKVEMVKKLEEILRDKIGKRNTLFWLAEEFCYETEAEWERLLEALQLIPVKTCRQTGTQGAVVDHTHDYVDIVDSRVLLIRVWVKHFGAEETRRVADELYLWEWLRDVQQVARGEYLQVAVEVGSLEGVRTLAWPGLLKWTNKGGKTAGEVSVELWGAQHEISKFLEERFQAVRAFHEEEPQ